MTNKRKEAVQRATLALAEQIARLETESEYERRTGDGMSGDDAVETLSALVRAARDAIRGRE